MKFVMEDDFNLDPDIKSRLQTPIQFIKITKGNYALGITEEAYTITLKLE